METTVEVRQGGAVTLPAALRERYHIRPGDTLRILDLDGVFVLTPTAIEVPALAREIESARLAAGLGMDELLDGLRQQRKRYTDEHYGTPP